MKGSGITGLGYEGWPWVGVAMRTKEMTLAVYWLNTEK